MKMRRVFLILLLAVFMAGCAEKKKDDDGTTINSAATPNNYFNETATLQGTVFDAITGNRLTDTSLKVTLVRGTNYQAASIRTGAAMDHWPGDYALTGIPISINSQTTYRIAVTMDGYQAFEAAVSLAAADNVSVSGTLDRNYNFLGNIYMFPLGVSANDVKVNVSFNGEPVEGATVNLNPQIGANTVLTDVSNTIFGAQTGFLGSLTATTGVDGVATFAGSDLALGGRYSIRVLSVGYEGVQLGQTAAASTIVIGSANIVQNVAMGELVPGAENGLYIVSASNTDVDNVQNDGVLTLVFSRPVSFVDETVVTATLTNETTAAINATNAPDSGVNGALSTDGLTLTLSPSYATDPVAFTGANGGTADNGLTVTYSNLFVRLVQANDTGAIFDVFGGLFDETGGNPNDAVLVTPNF